MLILIPGNSRWQPLFLMLQWLQDGDLLTSNISNSQYSTLRKKFPFASLVLFYILQMSIADVYLKVLLKTDSFSFYSSYYSAGLESHYIL